jgi:5-methylcytosine-specific restriction endonuclease McrA
MAKKKSRFSRLEARPRVLVEDPHLQSRAALLVLTRMLYSKREVGERPQWKTWLKFRKWFMRSRRKEGPLTCGFCGRSPLKTNAGVVPDRDLATIDHLVPRARGGREYAEDNLVVCCRKCNAKKADKLEF